MSISSVGSFQNVFSPASSATARQSSPGPSPTQAGPEAIGESGSAPFNHRNLIEGLKDKLRAQVLTEKNMSAETLNAMGSEQRMAAETEISHQVDLKLRETLERKAQDAASAGQTEGALLNIRA